LGIGVPNDSRDSLINLMLRSGQTYDFPGSAGAGALNGWLGGAPGGSRQPPKSGAAALAALTHGWKFLGELHNQTPAAYAAAAAPNRLVLTSDDAAAVRSYYAGTHPQATQIVVTSEPMELAMRWLEARNPHAARLANAAAVPGFIGNHGNDPRYPVIVTNPQER